LKTPGDQIPQAFIYKSDKLKNNAKKPYDMGRRLRDIQMVKSVKQLARAVSGVRKSRPPSLSRERKP